MNISTRQTSLFIKNDYELTVCYNRNLTSAFSILNSRRIIQNSLSASLPYFILQLFIAHVAYRISFYATKFIGLPHVVAQILCGALLNPLATGNSGFKYYIFPYQYAMVVETFANLGLVYYIFLLGLEIDFSLVKRFGSKALSISIAGLVGTFFVAVCSISVRSRLKDDQNTNENGEVMFWVVALGATSFSDLAKILSDLKLLRTETGMTAMSAAIITDLITWLYFIITVAYFVTEKHRALSIISTLAFALISWFLARPILSWAVSKTSKQRNESHLWFAFIGVALFGTISDVLGAHSIVGAFIFGVIMPRSHGFSNMLTEKLDEFVSTILMPLFYFTSGLRTDIRYVVINVEMSFLFVTVLGNCAAKVISTYLVSLKYGMPTRDGLALGFLMNTKGIFPLIILNAARDMQALSNRSFPLLVLILLIISCVTKPILSRNYRLKNVFGLSITEKMTQYTGFRILACVHNLGNISGITNLIKLSNPAPQSPLCIFAAHLVEFTGRTAASVLIMKDEYKSFKSGKFNDYCSKIEEPDQIANAFASLEKEDNSLTSHIITVVSPFDTMHTDICTLAKEKSVHFIILPFQKDSGEENQDSENINEKVLNNARCSVGILVDRGMSVTRSDSQKLTGDRSFHGYLPPKILSNKQIIMFFLGGPDDREALMYAWRMAGDPNVSLTVVRFEMSADEAQTTEKTWQTEKEMDEEILYEFTFKTANDYSIIYKEKVVNDGVGVIQSIKEIEDAYHLCIIGRGAKVKSPLLKGLSDWETCPDLGTIGDTLNSSNFPLQASILVVQQYSPTHDGN